MAKIWIVEDDEKIGLLIVMTVQKAGHEARHLLDATEMEKALEREPLPDLMLLDLMLRQKNGYTVLEEWKKRKATQAIPVIILSARSAEMDKVRGLELGAEDYITKPFGVRELQARIETALRRLPREKEKILHGPLLLLPASGDAYLNGKRLELTLKEFELLLFLARHPGETISRATLLKEVWGYATEDDPSRTVDTHIKTLRIKLGDSREEPRFIGTVRGMGYRLMMEEEA